MKKTIVVNLYAGPGTGKSTFCAGIFSQLKWKEVESEMALEYAKDLVWEQNFKKLENQLYVFAKQQNRIFSLNGKVDVIITDSPLLLSIIYDAKDDNDFKNLILKEYNRFTNLNYFLLRKKEYSQNGRIHTLEQAINIDKQIENLLDSNNIKYKSIIAIPENINIIVDDIIENLKLRGN